MSIKIEIESASVAEMHEELKALLFGVAAGRPALRSSGQVEAPEKQGQGKTEVVAEPKEAQETPETKPEEAEPVKKKRRTKAEIEAEKAAKEAEEAQQGEPETEEAEEEEAEEVPAKEEKAPAKITIHSLRELAVSKGSAKKPLIAKILQNEFGGRTFPNIDESEYPALYKKIEAL